MSSLPETLRETLSGLLGDRFTDAEAVRDHHAAGEGWNLPVRPAAVCFPMSTEEVSAVAAACATADVPMVPFGAGSSLEGHVAPTTAAVTVDLSRMNAIIDVSVEDLDCHVQAGVTREQLEGALRDSGLFFPVDPGADATIAGMVATGASGTTTVRYGAMRENVLGLTVVLADGRVFHTGGRARKSSAGYDLTRLFIASEGTLGFITEIRLRVRGIPEAVSAAVCQFPSVAGAVESVIEAIQIELPLARSELVDAVQMQAFIDHEGLVEYEAQPTLMLEFHGTENAVREQAEQMAEICGGHGGTGFRWATQQEDRTRLWRARHRAYFAAMAMGPGRKAMVTDACVPISRLAECIEATRVDLDESGLISPIVGHIGDGNFHCQILVDPDDEAEVGSARAFVSRLAARAIAMDGTCTGEHGVGLNKIAYVEREHGAAVDVMRAIKLALDPQRLMNPGKVLRFED
ncbi:MAG: FAD-binding protein [Acidobacteria bacterium]|nr:FAD-binding protein [Acidobacteriota bacterium]